MVIALGVQERPVGPVSKNMVESARRRQPLLTSGFCTQVHMCVHTGTLVHTHKDKISGFIVLVTSVDYC